MKFGVGDVLSKTMDILKERIGALIGLYVVFFVIQMVAFLAFGLLGGASMMSLGAGADPSAGLGGGMILGLFVFYLVYFLIYCAQSLSMSAKASPLRNYDIGDALGVGFRFSLTLLALFIILGVIAFIGSLVLGLVIGLVAGGTGSPEVGSALALLLILPLAIYLACRLSVTSPVVAVDEVKNPVSALSRTWTMTKGNVLTIFLSYLVLFVIAIVPLALFGLVFAGSIAGAVAGGTPELGGGIVIAGFLVFILFSVLFASAASAMVAVLHSMMTDSEGESLEATFE